MSDNERKDPSAQFNGVLLNKIRRKREIFKRDPSRVVSRFFSPGDGKRITTLALRLHSMPENEVSKTLASVLHDFSDRHRNIERAFHEHYQRAEAHVSDPTTWSTDRKLLLGAYLTQEYSVEAAALFNPSIVLHPDQKNIPVDSVRFILSFRATGKGHLSSIVFRSGMIDKSGTMLLDAVSPFVETSARKMNPTYHKHTFQLKLRELDAKNAYSIQIFDTLPDYFILEDLLNAVKMLHHKKENSILLRETVDIIKWIVQSNYEVIFQSNTLLSERVLFPVTQDESHGMEDARFVRFTEDDGWVTDYATYTAYNGHTVIPMLMATLDFVSFRMCTLNGTASRNKGLALFPRKINGKYMMISRLDGENLYLMQSNNLHFWDNAQLISPPSHAWELIRIGNCGSPLETKEGWLHLTHGVGPLRRYCIGVELRDLTNPLRLLGKLNRPLIVPDVREREGYVPNVVYTCGAMIHHGILIIPYAMSDTSSSVACVNVDTLLNELLCNGT